MPTMSPLSEFPKSSLKSLEIVLADIDDTLTLHGRLPAIAYEAMERIQAAGIKMIPITGRPAGWCDHIARMWPVDGIVGENGALYFQYDAAEKKLIRRFWKTDAERASDRKKLDVIRAEVLASVPGAGIASDQPYREADLAVDFCEDVPALSSQAIDDIVAVFDKHGATSKISSIHVNGWYGAYDKLSMTRKMLDEVFGVELDQALETITFLGDSPNDAPMFGHFPLSIGVANVRELEDRLEYKPVYVTEKPGGLGFAEFADMLLLSRGLNA